MDTIEGINNRRDCSDFFLVGLLGMIYRHWNDVAFPAGLKAPLEVSAYSTSSTGTMSPART